MHSNLVVLCVVTCHTLILGIIFAGPQHSSVTLCILLLTHVCIWSEENIHQIDRNELTWFSSAQPAMKAQTIEMSLFVIRIVMKPTRSPIAAIELPYRELMEYREKRKVFVAQINKCGLLFLRGNWVCIGSSNNFSNSCIHHINHELIPLQESESIFASRTKVVNSAQKQKMNKKTNPTKKNSLTKRN